MSCRTVIDSFGELEYVTIQSKRLPADRTMCQYYENKYAKKQFVQVLKDDTQKGVFASCTTKSPDEHSHRICACFSDTAVEAQIETGRNRDWLKKAHERWKKAKEHDKKVEYKRAEELKRRKQEEEAEKRRIAIENKERAEEERKKIEEKKRLKREEEAKKKREEEERQDQSTEG